MLSSTTSSSSLLFQFAVAFISVFLVLNVNNRMMMMIATGADAAKIFSYECQASSFTASTQPSGLCTAINAVLATPITSSENAQAFATITTNGAAMLGAVQAKDSNLITWRWSASAPNAGEIFWAQPNEVTGTAGYAPSVFTAWKATYPLANRPSYLILRTDGEWMDASFTTVRCAVCQKEACSTACYPAGTATPTGTWWPSCTCTCKPGWKGVACNRQIEVYPASVSTSVDLVSFCAGKGGFLAQPKSRADEDAILRVVTAAVAGGTNYEKLVTIGAYDTVTDGTYCYHDGPRNGECISTAATTVVGQYSDFNGAVPTGGGRIQTALDTFEEASDRWTAIKPQDTDQVACQFIDCSQVCSSSGTKTSAGTYPSCTCTCKPNWKGTLCDTFVTLTQTPTHLATRTTPITTTFSIAPTSTNSIDATSSPSPSLPTTPSNTHPYSASFSHTHTTSVDPSNTQSLQATPTLTSPMTKTRNTQSASLTQETPTLTHPRTPTTTFQQTVSEQQTSTITSTHSHHSTSTRSHPHTISAGKTSTGARPKTNTKSLQPSSTATPLVKRSHTVTHIPEVDYSNDTTKRTCPSISLLMYRANINATSTFIHTNIIKDTEVRLGRLLVNISLVGTLFAFGSSMPSTIQFTVESTGVQDPRSFPAVVNAHNVVCAFSPPTSRQFIVCTFPPSPDYKLRVAESLMVWGGGSKINPPCTDTPWLMGKIRVEPSTDDVLTLVFQVAAAVATGVATAVVMLLADGTPIEIQVMIVLLNSMCASDVDRESVVLVRYFLSPAIHLGWWWVVVVNVCVAVGFALLHTGVVASVYTYRLRQARKDVASYKVAGNTKKKRRVGSKERHEIILAVAASLLYPGLPIAVCHVFYIGVACGTFDVLRTKEGSEAAISALGIPFLIAVPIIDTYLLRRIIKAAYVPYDLLGCVPTAGCLRWLYPVGVWGPTASVRRFFGLIGPYRDGYRYGALIPLLLALIIGLTMHGLNDIVPCDYLFIVNAFVLFLVGALYVATRPTRATAQSFLTALCLLCVGALAVLQIVAIRANSTSIEAAKSALNYIVVFMVIVRSAHNMFVFYVEWKWAQEVDAAAKTTATNANKPSGITNASDMEEDDIPSLPVIMATFQSMLDEYAVDEIDGALVRERHHNYMDVQHDPDSTPSASSAADTEPAVRVRTNNVQNTWDDLVPIGGPGGEDGHDEEEMVSGCGSMSEGGGMFGGNPFPSLSNASFAESNSLAAFDADTTSAKFALNTSMGSISRPQQLGSVNSTPRIAQTPLNHSVGVISYADLLSMSEAADASISPPHRTLMHSRSDMAQFSLNSGGATILGGRTSFAPNTPSLTPTNGARISRAHPMFDQQPNNQAYDNINFSQSIEESTSNALFSPTWLEPVPGEFPSAKQSNLGPGTSKPWGETNVAQGDQN